MLRIEPKQSTFHSLLYNKIPDNHILKVIDQVVDFSFINDLLRNSYSKRMGRPAKEPELMCKLLFLQHLYNLSDERVVEEASLNLAHMYFLHLNPEDELPEKSLLAKFRCHRITGITLDTIITEIVKQCVDQDIIKSDGISIDATHIEANAFMNTAERMMSKMAKAIIKTHKKQNKTFKSIHEAPDFEAIENPDEAKAMMSTYVEDVIAEVESNVCNQETMEVIKDVQNILSDPKFMKQKGARSMVDRDARVGRKSKSIRFYGYKTEFSMTNQEHIITAILTENGAYTDGTYTQDIIKRTRESGLKIKEVYGDKAYFRKHILDEIHKIEAKAYIPISHSVYRIDEDMYEYNKDTDQWSCMYGNESKYKKYYKTKQKGGGREGYKYYFGKEICQSCPNKSECLTKGTNYKVLNLGLNTNEFYELSKEQKKESWVKKYYQRAGIECKNAELKRYHGLYRARGHGLDSVSKQSKLAAIAVNIKTIARLVAS